MATKRILTFNTAEVKPVVEDALAATELRVNFDDLYNPEYHKGGKVKKDANGFPDESNIDRSRIKTSLWLVGDQGVYLMSPAQFKEGQRRAVLAYAKECNPDVLEFDEWYDNKRRIYGGDDGSDSLPISWFIKAIESGKPTFRIQLLAKSLRLIV